MDGARRVEARPPRFGDTQASVLLDLVRGLAALVVLGEHWRNLLFVDYPQLQTHKLLWAIPYVLTGAGHQAVVIFFVLSGYLISGSIFRALDRGQWKWRSYMTHRVVRLWIVLLPGLLLCLALDRIGLHLHRAPLLYAGMSGNHMTPNVAAALSVPTFFGNLFFVQTIRFPVFGSDGALWSLANEFWYYVLFPLGLLALRNGPVIRRVLYGAGFVLAAWFVGRGILFGFPMWLAGVGLVLLRPPRVSPRLRWAAGICYVPLVFFLGRYRGISSLLSDYLLTAATFLLLWTLLSATETADREARPVRLARVLARFSFTLYVVHTPFLLLLTSVVQGDRRWFPNPEHVVVGLGILFAALMFCYAVAWATEFRTDGVRSWVESRLDAAFVPARNRTGTPLSR